MNEAARRAGSGAQPAHALALVLLQLAACRAGIGPFARRGRETPQVAAGRYRMTERREGTGGDGVVA